MKKQGAEYQSHSSCRHGSPRIAVLGFLFALTALFLAGSRDAPAQSPTVTDLQPADTGCPLGSLPAPPPLDDPVMVAASCAPVAEKPAYSSSTTTSLPEGHFAQPNPIGPGKPGDMIAESEPAPEGIAEAGTWYEDGAFPITYSSTFSAYVEVYPDYEAEEFTGYNEGVYETATNRTQAGVEFLARFRKPGYSDPDGWLMIFDWSCTPGFPCFNEAGEVKEAPAFVWDQHLPDVPCWYTMLEDNTGHFVNYAYFRNSTWIVEPRNPPADPLWRNEVWVWNYCINEYDPVYDHNYAKNQSVCALSLDCGGWAGIVERFPSNSNGGVKPPSIAKMGFHHQNLEYDGQSTRLLPENSHMITQVGAPWNVYALFANHTWEIGTFQDDDGDDVPNEIDPDIDGDLIPNTTEALCGVEASSGLWNPYIIPERIGGTHTAHDDDGDTLVDEGLPSGTSNLDCDGDGFTGGLENFVFSSSSFIDDQANCANTVTRNDEPDRWPVDFDDNRWLNILDLTGFSSRMNSAAPGPPYNVRWDLNGNGVINSLDLVWYSSLLNTGCSPS